MKNKRIVMGIAIIASMALFTSCIDNDVDLVGYGDAYILTELVGQDTVKALGLHAYSYSDMSSVTANLKDVPNPVYALQPYLGYKQDYTWSAPLSQFTTAIPPTGDYIFSAAFSNGESLVFSNRLTARYILPPKIKTCTYTLLNDRIDISWETVTRADSYNIKLLNQEGEILFVSPLYNSAMVNYTFNTATQGWQTGGTPNDGDSVIVELAAYMLEPGTQEGNLQSISKSRVTLTWGI